MKYAYRKVFLTKTYPDMKLSTSFIAALAFAASGAANATIVTAQDNFDSATSGAGWDGNWTLAGAKRNKPAPATITGSSLVFAADADDAAKRTLANAQDSDVFIDFTLAYSGVLGANDFVGMWFHNWNGPNIGLKANCGISNQSTCTTDLFVRTSGSGGYFLEGSNLEAGKSYQVFGHLYKSGEKGSNHYDRFDAWFKETGTDMVSKVVTAKDKSSLTSFDTLGFRSANIDNNVTVSVDNLRVANVPEPGSLALMGLAFAGLAAARRRQRA